MRFGFIDRISMVAVVVSCLRRLIVVLTVLVAVMVVPVGCTVEKSTEDGAGGNLYPPEEDSSERYLDVSLDGRVCRIDESGNTVPVAGLTVTMKDAKGLAVGSVETSEFGRYFIQQEDVAVGDYWEMHVYVEVADFREGAGMPMYEPRRVLKQIVNAPGGVAVLTMDDIIIADDFQR